MKELNKIEKELTGKLFALIEEYGVDITAEDESQLEGERDLQITIFGKDITLSFQDWVHMNRLIDFS